jgi:hypothetical protein
MLVACSFESVRSGPIASMSIVGTSHLMKSLAKKTAGRTRPTIVLGTVPPRKPLNIDRRPREYLTPKEVERLIAGREKAQSPVRPTRRDDDPRCISSLGVGNRGAQARR